MKFLIPYALTIYISNISAYAQHLSITYDSLQTIDTIVFRKEINEITKIYNVSQKLIQIPGAVSYLKTDETYVSNPGNLLSEISTKPGIFVQQGTLGTSHITLRGIGTRYAYGTRKIKIFYNDIPLTNSESDSFIDDIPPEETGSVEIIRGPASSAYGSSLGGTILISSNKESNTNKVMYSSGIGSFGLFKNIAQYSAPMNNGNIIAGISHFKNNGYRENNYYERTSAFLNLNGALINNIRFDLLLSYASVFSQIPSSLDLFTYENTPYKAAANWLKTKGNENYTRFIAGINLNKKMGTSGNTNFTTYATTRKGIENRPFNILYDNLTGWGINLKYNTKTIASWNFISFNSGYTLYTESYIASLYDNIEGTGTKGGLEDKNKTNTWQNNLFAQMAFKFPEAYTLTVSSNINLSGMLFNTHSLTTNNTKSVKYKFDPIISPRIAILKSLKNTFAVYMQFSHGFSLPSISEIGTSGENISFNLKPEVAWNLEGGFRGTLLKDIVFIDFAIYRMWVTNLIIPKRIAEDTYIGMNAGKSIHEGIELENKIHLTGKYDKLGNPLSAFTLTFANSLNINHFIFREFTLDSINFNGKKLPGTPSVNWTCSILTECKTGIYLKMNLFGSGKIPLNDNNSVYTKSYYIIDANLGYKTLLFKKMKFSFHCKIANIMNTKYTSMVVVNAPGTTSPPRYYYPGLPTNWTIGMTLGYVL